MYFLAAKFANASCTRRRCHPRRFDVDVDYDARIVVLYVVVVVVVNGVDGFDDARTSG